MWQAGCDARVSAIRATAARVRATMRAIMIGIMKAGAFAKDAGTSGWNIVAVTLTKAVRGCQRACKLLRVRQKKKRPRDLRRRFPSRKPNKLLWAAGAGGTADEQMKRRVAVWVQGAAAEAQRRSAISGSAARLSNLQ